MDLFVLIRFFFPCISSAYAYQTAVALQKKSVHSENVLQTRELLFYAIKYSYRKNQSAGLHYIWFNISCTGKLHEIK